MKQKTKIYRWNKSQNKTKVVIGSFDSDKISDCTSIEVKRIKQLIAKPINWIV